MCYCFIDDLFYLCQGCLPVSVLNITDAVIQRQHTHLINGISQFICVRFANETSSSLVKIGILIFSETSLQIHHLWIKAFWIPCFDPPMITSTPLVSCSNKRESFNAVSRDRSPAFSMIRQPPATFFSNAATSF